MWKKQQIIVWIGIVGLLAAGITGAVLIKKTHITSSLAPVVVSPTLKPAEAIDPATGICRDFPGTDTAAVTITDDVPDPKCLKVLPDQKLKVINKTQTEVSVYLGEVRFKISPGGEYVTDKKLGSFLAPGVHVPVVAPGRGPEIWLQKQ